MEFCKTHGFALSGALWYERVIVFVVVYFFAGYMYY